MPTTETNPQNQNKAEYVKPASAATGAGFLLKKKEGYDKLFLLPFSNLTAERRCGR